MGGYLRSRYERGAPGGKNWLCVPQVLIRKRSRIWQWISCSARPVRPIASILGHKIRKQGFMASNGRVDILLVAGLFLCLTTSSHDGGGVRGRLVWAFA